MTTNTPLLHLLHLCDPALPIGSFSHSAGLESYVQAGVVINKETALEFIIQQLLYNIQHTDAAFASLAYDAADKSDDNSLLQLDSECSALKTAKETRLASNKLGLRLLKIFATQTQLIHTNLYLQAIQQANAAGHFSIAFGILANELTIPKHEALTGYYYNAAAGFVTNCVKLIPLGQLYGQELLVSLFPLIEQLAKSSLFPKKEIIGYCCPAFEIRCMQHEQLYSRLYMS